MSVWRMLRNARAGSGGNAAVFRASLLQQICESGANRNVRLWALQEMPAALRDSAQLWEIALPALVACTKGTDNEVAQAAADVLAPVAAAEGPWACQLLAASIGSSVDRDVLLFAIPITERFADPTDVTRAIDALFHCYENVLDEGVRTAIEGALCAHKRDHPREYGLAEAAYAGRTTSWIDRLILERVDERHSGRGQISP